MGDNESLGCRQKTLKRSPFGWELVATKVFCVLTKFFRTQHTIPTPSQPLWIPLYPMLRAPPRAVQIPLYHRICSFHYTIGFFSFGFPQSLFIVSVPFSRFIILSFIVMPGRPRVFPTSSLPVFVRLRPVTLLHNHLRRAHI